MSDNLMYEIMAYGGFKGLEEQSVAVWLLFVNNNGSGEITTSGLL